MIILQSTKTKQTKKKEHLFIRLYTFEGQNWKKEKKKKSKLKESVHIMPNRYVTVRCRVKSEIQSSLCKQTPCHIFVVRLFTCTYALYIEPNCVMYIFI